MRFSGCFEFDVCMYTVGFGRCDDSKHVRLVVVDVRAAQTCRRQLFCRRVRLCLLYVSVIAIVHIQYTCLCVIRYVHYTCR